MSDVEVRLSEPWCAPGKRIAERNRPSHRILGHIDPLVAAIWSNAFGDLAPEISANVYERKLWAALVGSLEKTERRGPSLPGQLVVYVALEGIRTISRQGSVV